MTTDQTFRLLRKFESRNVTFLDPAGGWPMVWQRARGVWVWDTAGRKYLDLTAAFGVAAVGHACPAVVRAGKVQLGLLPHAMGDVHPHPGKAQLAQALSGVTYERWLKRGHGKTIFCNSGFEAVEAALKTAVLATRRGGVVAFTGAYHGTGYGTLNLTHREHFSGPFRSQLKAFGTFLPFPDRVEDLPRLERLLTGALGKGRIGAVLVEPIQARGGIRIPPTGFLQLLRKLCDRQGAALIFDEIYTGFGRTGKLFRAEHENVTPDLVCVGKALAGGYPISACVGLAELMDRAWPASNGEAIHTSTFLGNPVGCAMALAQMREIDHRKLAERSARLGSHLLQRLSKIAGGRPDRMAARGAGLMAGIEFRDRSGAPDTRIVLRLTKQLLAKGLIALPEGAHSEVLSFTPPLVIRRQQLEDACDILAGLISKL